MHDRDAQDLTPRRRETLLATFIGTRIEVAWNPATRRWEDIWPESEGYYDVPRIPMVWCRSAGRYVTIPTD